jgi:hypothetical protein
MKERAGNFSFLSLPGSAEVVMILSRFLRLQFDFTGGRVGHCTFYSKCKSKVWKDWRKDMKAVILYFSSPFFLS